MADTRPRLPCYKLSSRSRSRAAQEQGQPHTDQWPRAARRLTGRMDEVHVHLLVEDVCGHDANCQRTHSSSTHPFEICRGSPHTASRSFSSRNTFTPGRANRTTHVQTATDNVAKQWSDQQRTRPVWRAASRTDWWRRTHLDHHAPPDELNVVLLEGERHVPALVQCTLAPHTLMLSDHRSACRRPTRARAVGANESPPMHARR